jgi:hypothetical protein
MHALEEKNALTQELEKTRKVAEDLQGEKVKKKNFFLISFSQLNKTILYINLLKLFILFLTFCIVSG